MDVVTPFCFSVRRPWVACLLLTDVFNVVSKFQMLVYVNSK